MMDQKHSRCLVLNADYSPLTIINWQRALVWSMKYQDNHNLSIQIIDFYKDDYILGANYKKYPIPAVVKTNNYFKISNQYVKFSRKNIYIRDDYTCQYCGKTPNINELTYDHVIPKSSWSSIVGSPTSWTNIVSACVSCNRKKGNKTPKQANMPLKNIPVMPQKNTKYLPIAHHLSKIKENIPEEWSLYISNIYFN